MDLPAAPTITVRRATSQDVEAILPLAAKCVAGSPHAGKVPDNDDSVRSMVLRCIVGGTIGAVMLVAEERRPIAGRELETELQIVGAIMGEMRTVWHSKQPIAEHLGGFHDDYMVAEMLRSAFRSWARDTQHAPCMVLDGFVEKLR